MISNALEVAGFGFITLAAYEFSGRVAAFAVLGSGLLFAGFVLDGMTVKIPRVTLPRKKPKQKPKLTDEPLTNREMDLLEQAVKQ